MQTIQNFFQTRKKVKIFLLSALLIFSLGFFFYSDKMIALAENIIDSFTDTSKVGDTWNVEVDTGSGKVRLAQKTCDSDVWICSASTTCSNTLGDGDYIIVASTTLPSAKQWKTTNTNCDQPECGQDGGQADDNLIADNTVNFSVYPARDACKTLGGRLPTIGELSCIYDNQASFNGNFSTGYHWSATENSDTYARFVYFSGGDVGGSGKTGSYSVRCVRGW